MPGEDAEQPRRCFHIASTAAADGSNLGRRTKNGSAFNNLLARSEGFEPPTPRFEVWCSIRLSYERLRELPGPVLDNIQAAGQFGRCSAASESIDGRPILWISRSSAKRGSIRTARSAAPGHEIGSSEMTHGGGLRGPP